MNKLLLKATAVSVIVAFIVYRALTAAKVDDAKEPAPPPAVTPVVRMAIDAKMRLDAQEVSLFKPAKPVRCLAFNSDGTILASAEDEIVLWNPATRAEKKRLASFDPYSIVSLAFSPDGRTLAASRLDASVKLIDLRTNRVTRELAGDSLLPGKIGRWEQVGLQAARFSPDGKVLAVTRGDETVGLWDMAEGKELATLRGHGAPVRVMAFSPDGKTLATGTDYKMEKIDDSRSRSVAPGEVKLWDWARGKEKFVRLPSVSGRVQCLAFSPNRRAVAIGMSDAIVLWDLEADKEQRRIPLAARPGPGEGQPHTRLSLTDLAFSSDGKWLGMLGSETDATMQKTFQNLLLVWDAESGKEQATLALVGLPVNSEMVLAPNLNWLAMHYCHLKARDEKEDLKSYTPEYRLSVWKLQFPLSEKMTAPDNLGPMPKPGDATAKEILDRMTKVYGNCRSYRDSGVVKTVFFYDTGKTHTTERPFLTAFERPGRFRFEFSEKMGDRQARYIIWTDGKDVQTWWDVTREFEKLDSLGHAVGGAVGVSSNSSKTIPGLLGVADVSGGKIAHIKSARRVEDGKLEAIECFRIEGTYGGHPIIVWIDKKSYLVRRIDEKTKFDTFRTEETTTYDPTINEKIADSLLEFDPPVQK